MIGFLFFLRPGDENIEYFHEKAGKVKTFERGDKT